MRIIFALCFFISSIANAAVDCKAKEARDALGADSNLAMGLVREKLRKAISDCFNPGKPDYIAKTNALFDLVEKTVSPAVSSVTSSYDTYVLKSRAAKNKALATAKPQSGQTIDFDALAELDESVVAAATYFRGSIPPAKNNVELVLKKIVSNEGNLTEYGFTTSDNKENGQPKYPNCNSTRNDKPAENWKTFLRAIKSIPSEMERLHSAVNCQADAANASGAVLENRGRKMGN